MKQIGQGVKISKNNSSISGCVVSVLIFFCIGLFGTLGLVIGVVSGSSANNQGLDLRESPVLFDKRSPPEEMPLFWAVQYEINEFDTPPRLIEISDPDFYNSDWFLGPPTIKNRKSQGPWETEQGGLTHQPRGNLQIHAGGVHFDHSQLDSLQVELVLYPDDVQNGWVRWYYTYEVRDGLIIPVLLRRERQSSDWALDMLVYSAFTGAVIGLFIGIAFSVFGVVWYLAIKMKP